MKTFLKIDPKGVLGHYKKFIISWRISNYFTFLIINAHENTQRPFSYCSCEIYAQKRGENMRTEMKIFPLKNVTTS